MDKLERILHYFPETQLPVIISEDHLSEYENNAEAFPQAFIDEVITTWEKDVDEFTEFIPCFQLPKEEKFNAVVYWKGGLLKYDFVLVTLDKKGELISKKSIASTVVTDHTIKKSVASIEPDLIINIIAGQTEDGDEYDAAMSKAFAMEILPSGEIIFNLDGIG
ncbi:MAG: hypothetical protein U0T36_00300 [Saprospiraceae bacterium]|jgi:hypothetical protein